MSQLSENLKLIRSHLKLTQCEFSKILEIGFRTYVRYEIGEREPPIPVLVKIKKMLKISLDDLILSSLHNNGFIDQTRESSRRENIKNSAKSPHIANQSAGFPGSSPEQTIALKKDEKNFFNLYKKMDVPTREKCLLEMQSLIKNSIHSKNRSVDLSENSKTKKVAKLKKASGLPKRMGEKD